MNTFQNELTFADNLKELPPEQEVEAVQELHEVEKDEQEVLHTSDRYSILNDRDWADRAVSNFHYAQ